MRIIRPPRRSMNASNQAKLFFKRFYIFIVLAIIYIPLIIIILLSFNGQTEKGNVVINFDIPTAENYIELFKNNEFLNALANSAIISVIVVPISVIIAIITCFGIWNARNSYINSIMGMSKVSVAMPEPITAISLALLFSTTVIPLGFDFGMFTICLAHICFCTPYAILSIYPKMQKMNRNLIWASYDLGYSRAKTFFKIVIPYLAPAILSASAVTLAMSLDDFIITHFTKGAGLDTLSTKIYTEVKKGIKPEMYALSTLIFVSVLILLILVNKLPETERNK